MDGNVREAPRIERNFSQPLRDIVNENIAGQLGLVALQVFRDDLFALHPAAEHASAVAAVRRDGGRAAITREGGRRYVGVRMNVRGRDMGSFVEEARRRVASAVNLPAGYEVAWGGEFEDQQRAMARLRLVIPLSL